MEYFDIRHFSRRWLYVRNNNCVFVTSDNIEIEFFYVSMYIQ